MKNLNSIKNILLAPVVIALSATFSVAFAQHADKEMQEDIQRHRAMAAAHEAAAKCLESGKKDEVCEKELQAACKGLAIGKYCGMKHVH
ncbi:MAG: hypothetical protein JWP96_1012 [Polaromonas sp.]|nr:hypothetical protein [Polaromonas sp.]